MHPLHISLRVVCYREGETWFAHCLEFDVIGDGSTQTEAIAQLAEAIRIQLEFSIEHDNLNNLFSPADGDLFLRYAAGKKSEIAANGLLIRIDPITIEAAEIHEFQEVLAAA
jgi:predicted RNase H-like HicB family nuclease